MGVFEDFRRRARATWASGDWDSFSRLLEPVGAVVLGRIDLRPGLDLLDVGTGTGGTVAIPAARRGAKVVGLDVAPELFEHARRRAAEAGVDVEWVEGDAQDLPFADESFDRVVSTFGAMFALAARAVLEPQGRWAEFHQGFADLVHRFNLAGDGTTRIRAEYLLITVER